MRTSLLCGLVAVAGSMLFSPPIRAEEPPAPGRFLDDVHDDLRVQGGIFLSEEKNAKRIATEVIKAEVELAIKQARERMRNDPEGARNSMKTELENVGRAPDLDPEVRNQLRSQLESAIKEASRLKTEKDSRDQLTQAAAAAALDRERRSDALDRRSEKMRQIMARYASLMLEERYREAEELAAIQAAELDHGTVPEVSKHAARIRGYLAESMAIREARHKNFVDAMAQVDRSNVPFPDEPPITYPDAEVWQELTLRRKKFASVDLQRRGSKEEAIFNALEQSTKLEFTEMPLIDVLEYLKELHGIEIQLDRKALEDIGLGPDTPITRNLNGVSLKAALRLMLRDLDLTYQVRDEVLVITTHEVADANLTTKVYPVADLVLPISSGAGANPFMLGGGLGGQGGFGGGMGMGGGGGMNGMNGGGFGQNGGFGGPGGIF